MTVTIRVMMEAIQGVTARVTMTVVTRVMEAIQGVTRMVTVQEEMNPVMVTVQTEVAVMEQTEMVTALEVEGMEDRGVKPVGKMTIAKMMMKATDNPGKWCRLRLICFRQPTGTRCG